MILYPLIGRSSWRWKRRHTQTRGDRPSFANHVPSETRPKSLPEKLIAAFPSHDQVPVTPIPLRRTFKKSESGWESARASFSITSWDTARRPKPHSWRERQRGTYRFLLGLPRLRTNKALCPSLSLPETSAPDGQRVVRLVACKSRGRISDPSTQNQLELRRMAPK